MFRLWPAAVWFIALVIMLAVATLYVAYGYISSAQNKDVPCFLFWMEVSKPIMQMLYITLGGGIIAGFLKILFDSVQSRRQTEEAKNQFRKDIIADFIDARYEATGKRDKFLNARSDKLESLYRSMMEDEFISIKEKMSKVWHDVETGKQSLTYHEEVKSNVIAMKRFFDNMLEEYRTVKDLDIPDTMEFFLKIEIFRRFLK